ncbi:hypothetical protein HMPREF3225_00999 [Staphylococcus lugdunensis]|uniref:Uncharacterized protein n=2 Tax=Staphylococcus lugdunensis TaxID=28035 RepID=A0ABD4EGP1_STALU|nr:hypothetical protein HMPREF3225_00999 [Staphylococcus lugdunensis]
MVIKGEFAMTKVDLNKQNVINAVRWIIRNQESIIFNRQHELSFFSKEDLEHINYCRMVLDSLIESKHIYDKQKIS